MQVRQPSPPHRPPRSCRTCASRGFCGSLSDSQSAVSGVSTTPAFSLREFGRPASPRAPSAPRLLCSLCAAGRRSGRCQYQRMSLTDVWRAPGAPPGRLCAPAALRWGIRTAPPVRAGAGGARGVCSSMRAPGARRSYGAPDWGRPRPGRVPRGSRQSSSGEHVPQVFGAPGPRHGRSIPGRPACPRPHVSAPNRLGHWAGAAPAVPWAGLGGWGL